MLRSLLLLSSLVLPAPARAQDAPAEPVSSPTTEENRDHTNVTASYTVFSTGLILPKRGPALSYVSSKRWTFELAYLSGDVELGYHGLSVASFKEELYLAEARYYPGNLINLFFGLGERRYSLDLGSDELSRIAPDAPNSPVLEVRNQVAEFGFGNRWQWERGFTLGIDWLALLIPVGKGSVDAPFLDYIEDEDTRNDTKSVLKILRYIPTFTAFKLHLGWTF